MSRPVALIVTAPGTNRDPDAADAFDRAGAEPVIADIRQLREEPQRLAEARILCLAGGFSYADASEPDACGRSIYVIPPRRPRWFRRRRNR